MYDVWFLRGMKGEVSGEERRQNLGSRREIIPPAEGAPEPTPTPDQYTLASCLGSDEPTR